MDKQAYFNVAHGDKSDIRVSYEDYFYITDNLLDDRLSKEGLYRFKQLYSTNYYGIVYTPIYCLPFAAIANRLLIGPYHKGTSMSMLYWPLFLTTLPLICWLAYRKPIPRRLYTEIFTDPSEDGTYVRETLRENAPGIWAKISKQLHKRGCQFKEINEQSTDFVANRMIEGQLIQTQRYDELLYEEKPSKFISRKTLMKIKKKNNPQEAIQVKNYQTSRSNSNLELQNDLQTKRTYSSEFIKNPSELLLKQSSQQGSQSLSEFDEDNLHYQLKEIQLIDLEYDHLNQLDNLSKNSIDNLNQIMKKTCLLRQKIDEPESIDLIMPVIQVTKQENQKSKIFLSTTEAIYLLHTSLQFSDIRISFSNISIIFLEISGSKLLIKSTQENDDSAIYIEHSQVKYIASSILTIALEIFEKQLEIVYLSGSLMNKAFKSKDQNVFLRNRKSQQYDNYLKILKKNNEKTNENYIDSWDVFIVKLKNQQEQIDCTIILSSQTISFMKNSKGRVKFVQRMNLSNILQLKILDDSSCFYISNHQEKMDFFVEFDKSKEICRKISEVISSIQNFDVQLEFYENRNEFLKNVQRDILNQLNGNLGIFFCPNINDFILLNWQKSKHIVQKQLNQRKQKEK